MVCRVGFYIKTGVSMLNGSNFEKRWNAIRKLVLLSSIFGIVLSMIGQLFEVLTDFFISGISRPIGGFSWYPCITKPEVKEHRNAGIHSGLKYCVRNNGCRSFIFARCDCQCLNWVQAKQKVKRRKHEGADLNRLLFCLGSPWEIQ